MTWRAIVVCECVLLALFVAFALRYFNQLYSASAHEQGMALAQQTDSFDKSIARCSLDHKAGCIHGAVMYLAAQRNLSSKSAINVCQDLVARISRVRYLNCLHGMGHYIYQHEQGNMLMFLDFCDLPSEEYLNACASGIFMEYSLGADSHIHTRHLNFREANCSEVPEKFKKTCSISNESYRLLNK